jgi:hypothetical protein
MFGNKDVKREQKTQALMQKYGLEDLSDPRDKQAVQNIATNLMGNKLIELGAALQGNGADAAKMSYLNAIMEQNFIMIRQLDRIAKSLEK